MRRAAVVLSAAVASAVAAAGAQVGNAVPASASACTKAVATAAVKQLGLSDPAQPNPVFKVLCGALAGPGSETMVVSILGPENVGMTHWVVLRRTGSGWEVLLRRQQAAVLTAAGRDIQESVSIYRAGDPRCCPSGGTKVRSWRWNGRSFVASAWVRDVPTRFDSPSGNIRCWMYDGTRSDLTRAVGCFSKTPPRFVRLSPDGRLTISRNRSDCGCDEPKNRTLAYGEQITVGRFRCRSLQIGVRCTVVSFGRGFLINRDGVTRVG